MKNDIPFQVPENILNDNTDYKLCYACGKNNEHGLQLKFKYINKESYTQKTLILLE